jgi:SAM-dependent methyltransferase
MITQREVMPSPETYEREVQYMPYRKSLQMVEDIVCADAPRSGGVIDFMCGTGLLLRKISERRPDLFLFGIDNDETYVKYARDNFGFDIDLGDVTVEKDVDPVNFFDVALCTGALHHIPYEKQEQVIRRIALATKPEGFAILSDAYVDDFSNERERQRAAARLGYEYLRATIQKDAPEDVVEATANILVNDVMGREFKTSLAQRIPALRRHFADVRTMKVWPDKQIGGYGDYVHILMGRLHRDYIHALIEARK